MTTASRLQWKSTNPNSSTENTTGVSGDKVIGYLEELNVGRGSVSLWRSQIELLQAKIREYILPGSHIISDGWAAYANVSGIGGGIYSHEVVVHERLFVDPDDEEIHTQNVENIWMRAKRKIRRQCGTSRDLFPGYMHEFLFPNSVKQRDVLSELLTGITQFSGVITATSCPKIYASRHYRRCHL